MEMQVGMVGAILGSSCLPRWFLGFTTSLGMPTAPNPEAADGERVCEGMGLLSQDSRVLKSEFVKGRILRNICSCYLLSRDFTKSRVQRKQGLLERPVKTFHDLVGFLSGILPVSSLRKLSFSLPL